MKRLIFIITLLLSVSMYANAFEVDGIAYNINRDELSVTVTGGSKKTGTLTIPERVSYNSKTYSVTSIGHSAFFGCNDFTGSLNIPNSVTTIGDYAFYDCNGFTGSLTIPNSVTAIGDYAFAYCSGFTGSLTIPNSVTSIGDRTFDGCSGFTGSLNIPNSVTTIGAEAFSGCSGFNGSLNIPNSVTTIGEQAFGYCKGFTGEINIPNSVNSIGDGAFYFCSGFTGSLNIPNSVTSIGIGAFTRCAISEVKVDAGNTVYDSRDNCNAIIETRSNTLIFGCINTLIPNSVISIGEEAFDGSELSGPLTIPNSVTTIGNFAFFYCKKLTGTLIIPNSVTTIGEHALYGCSFTGELTIPNSVTTIGEQAFGMNKFTGTLCIGNSVTSIGTSAFSGCGKLTKIYSLNPTPPTIESGTFDYSKPLYVPEESVNKYKSAENWEKFNSIYPIPNKATSIVLDQKENTTIETSLFQLYPTIEPADFANQEIAWKSSNEEIATVDTHGRIKALKPGKVTVTATTTDGSNLSAQCEVTIMMKGDMNEDFVIDVTDMSSIINIILKGK